MFTSPPEMSEMHLPMHGYMSSFMEEKMVKAILVNSGCKTNKRTTLRKEGQTFLL